ncbi:hypothetical protein HPB52_015461 [Rhipicephalus sanguineus]|uniref:Uncharacterized protein n=1 Tax=Rhipicephalus sanguineus TaxID=34632 RepID=A0A9D4PSX8_RHISA|nr:hypothetical protein HPB52_015461 [Rhipicephalus sanguineus]
MGSSGWILDTTVAARALSTTCCRKSPFERVVLSLRNMSQLTVEQGRLLRTCSKDEVCSGSAPSTTAVTSQGEVVSIQVPTEKKVAAHANGKWKQAGSVPRFVRPHVEARHTVAAGAQSHCHSTAFERATREALNTNYRV